MLTQEVYTVFDEIESLLMDTMGFACCLQTVSELAMHTACASGCDVTAEALGCVVSHHAGDIVTCINRLQDKLVNARIRLEVRP